MTSGDWIGPSLLVVATGGRRSGRDRRVAVGRPVSNERKADARWRADEHLKTIHALIVEWFQAYRQDRGRAFGILMAAART